MNLSKELTIDLSISITIDSDQLDMYNFETGETMKYNMIPENEVKQWGISSYQQALKKSNDYETHGCSISEV